MEVLKRDTLRDLLSHLNDEQPARTFSIPEKCISYFKSLQLLTNKKMLYVANTSESPQKLS